MIARSLGALAAAFLAALLGLPALAASEPVPIVEAVNSGGIYGTTHSWSPAQVTVASGGAVTFSNQTAVPHGVEWRTAVKPSCEEGAGKVPVGTTPSASGTHWSGSCTFAQPGAYTFWCTVHHAEMSGTVTVPGTPSAATEAPAAVTQTSATLAGAIDPQGQAVEYLFQYGTASLTEHATARTSLPASDFSSHAVSASVAGLSPASGYEVELVVLYGPSATRVTGGELSFATPAPAAPLPTTGPASAVGETHATLAGTVDPEGGSGTEYRFQYGPTAAYGQSTPLLAGLPADNERHSVTATVGGLLPGTTYHFRLLARNSVGEAGGQDLTFTTASPPALEPILPPSGPAPGGGGSVASSSGASSTAPSTVSAAPALPPLVPPLLLVPGTLAPRAGRGVVRGSLQLGPAAVGGRLEIDVLTAQASLARRAGVPQVLVGKLVRRVGAAGRSSFSVALDGRARRALRRHKRLRLLVRATLAPPGGGATAVALGSVLARS
jgi:plastocyanin